MMRFHPLTMLRQTVAATPLAMYSLGRLNRGYQGPVLRVRRSNDNAEADCYTPANILAHCGANNGFVATAYDQSGNGRHLTNSGSLQPQVCAAGAILAVSGMTGLQFTLATGTHLVRGDNIGMPTGNPAITTLLQTANYLNTAPPSAVPFWIGPDSGGSEAWYSGRPTATTQFVTARNGPACTFNLSPDPTSNKIGWVIEKALNANMNTATMRCNGVALTVNTSTSGNQNITVTTGKTAWGAAMSAGGVGGAQQNPTMLSSLLVHYNATFTTLERDALEAILLRMRSQT